MKKLFALILVLCMLLPAATVAEAIAPDEAIDCVFDECPIDIMLAEGIKVSQTGGNWKISFGSKYGDFSYLVDGSTGEILEKNEPEIDEKPSDPASDAIDACFSSLEGYDGKAENIKLNTKRVDGELIVNMTFDWNGKAYDMTYNAETGAVTSNSEEPVSVRKAPEKKNSSASEPEESASPYLIGTSENTFAGLHARMCVNLDLKANPIPTPEEEVDSYGTGDKVYATVLKDDSTSYEYIGYVRGTTGENKYIIWYWTGMHEDGSVISQSVYYMLDGKYLGNIQRDRTAGTSTSSSRCPYFVPSEPINKK